MISRSIKILACVSLIILLGIVLLMNLPESYKSKTLALLAFCLMGINCLLSRFIGFFADGKEDTFISKIIVLYSFISIFLQFLLAFLFVFGCIAVQSHFRLPSEVIKGIFFIVVFAFITVNIHVNVALSEGKYREAGDDSQTNNENDLTAESNKQAINVTLKRIVVNERDFDNADSWSIPKGSIDQLISDPVDGSECVICIQVLKGGENCATLSCRHRYHLKCLVHLKGSSSVCCICRRNFEMQYNGLNYPISRVCE
jgi:hypothetical protein